MRPPASCLTWIVLAATVVGGCASMPAAEGAATAEPQVKSGPGGSMLVAFQDSFPKK